MGEWDEFRDDPDFFRVDDPPQHGVIHGHVTDDWPRFKPSDLRDLLREAWAAGGGDPDGTACSAYVLRVVPLRVWERNAGV